MWSGAGNGVDESLQGLLIYMVFLQREEYIKKRIVFVNLDTIHFCKFQNYNICCETQRQFKGSHSPAPHL